MILKEQSQHFPLGLGDIAIYWTCNLGFTTIEYKNNTCTNLIHIKSKKCVAINCPCRVCRDYISPKHWLLVFLTLFISYLRFTLYANFILFVCFTPFYLCVLILYIKYINIMGLKFIYK